MLCVASSKVREVYGVGLWKAIKKEEDVLSCKVSFLVGDSRRVRFWKDKWYGDEPLCISFPSLFVVAFSKEVWVELVWSHSSEGGCWAPYFFRHFDDWEMESLERFLLRLHGRRVSKDKEDDIMWIESKDGTFSVKSLFKAWELGRQSVFLTRVI
ncbi:hypothetical protein CK203_059677 [Vitis vinifera]|uniref:Uncharacterized protein n=1 Tax=Vitis vinifera TaxID=29760 RepID=A0A438GFL5_VITVI|nr:hypothetical protein CK203_059677 [Vitis vinifera]